MYVMYTDLGFFYFYESNTCFLLLLPAVYPEVARKLYTRNDFTPIRFCFHQGVAQKLAYSKISTNKYMTIFYDKMQLSIIYFFRNTVVQPKFYSLLFSRILIRQDTKFIRTASQTQIYQQCYR